MSQTMRILRFGQLLGSGAGLESSLTCVTYMYKHSVENVKTKKNAIENIEEPLQSKAVPN